MKYLWTQAAWLVLLCDGGCAIAVILSAKIYRQTIDMRANERNLIEEDIQFICSRTSCIVSTCFRMNRRLGTRKRVMACQGYDSRAVDEALAVPRDMMNFANLSNYLATRVGSFSPSSSTSPSPLFSHGPEPWMTKPMCMQPPVHYPLPMNHFCLYSAPNKECLVSVLWSWQLN